MTSEIIIRDDGTKEWYKRNKLHRIDGPAIEQVNGIRAWFFNGGRHRTDGPAVEFKNGDKQWWINGKLHRTDGPAVEFNDGKKYWFIHGNQIDFEEICKIHELNSDWTQWTDSEKVLFRLAV